MKIEKKIAVKTEIPGATVRQQTEFGDATGYGRISGEYFSLSKGVDTIPLFQGSDGDLCQCPHWGFVISGKLTTTDAKGIKESVQKDDLFYWPPGHNVFVEEDANSVMFSPQHKHTHVINHMVEKVSQQPS
ncbi:MAG: cupin domain-containing protein [Deltaproteobacteria bacterium]|nr:cupin domain-containing protein [Deltaproteobacteria bacterium]